MITKIKDKFSNVKGSFVWFFSIGCVVFGLLIAFVSLLMVGFDINRLNTDGEWEQRTLVQSLGEINEILIDSRNVRIEVRPSGGDEIVITYFENNQTTFTETITNNRISLIQDRNTRNFRLFTVGIHFNVGNSGIVVEVPKEAYLSGEFRTTNGRIEIREIDFVKLQVSSSNGPLRLDEVTVTGEVVASTTNSVIHLSNSDFDCQVNLTTTNGRITLEAVQLEGDIGMRTTSGAVNLSDVHSTGDITVNTTNGRIDVNNVNITGDFDFRSSNGMIILERSVFFNGTLTTTNGRVIVNDLQDHEKYRFITETSNGRTIIGELRLEGRRNSLGEGERLLDIRTSNGNIEVSFQ